MDEPTRIYRCRGLYTMDRSRPVAEAVAVQDGRIVAVGSVDEVTTVLDGRTFEVDDRWADQYVLPGLIDQHVHPILGATTLATVVIAPEEWIMPTVTFPAVETPDAFDEAMKAAVADGAGDSGMVCSWGYHELWHGPLDIERFDRLTGDVPVCVWQRSCHEFYINSATTKMLGLTPEMFADKGPDSDRLDFAQGHYWEGGGVNLLLPHIAPYLMSEERLRVGLHQLIAYLHQNGVTAINEPGIIWDIEPWDLYDEILGAEDVPLLTTFLIDARSSQSAKGMPAAQVVEDAARQAASKPGGRLRIFDRQVKMFSDGAIISQRMQMRDPYLDRDGRPDPDHHGEWMMEPDTYHAYFDEYWRAGWQIHTHVNGDAGLDMVLDAMERSSAATPRTDHRCVIVHFANSTPEQIERIARLGAIVSANPYYPCGFADKYGEVGLGPERADAMVRSSTVLAAGIPLSFHSDLPMAQAEPLRLAGYGASRQTASGRVAEPDLRISVEDALRAVTIEAAYSWRHEHEIGSIEVGKVANFTVLAADPFDTPPERLHKIPVAATCFEGRVFPVTPPASSSSGSVTAPAARALGAVPPPAADAHGHGGCSCVYARRFVEEAMRVRESRAA